MTLKEWVAKVFRLDHVDPEIGIRPINQPEEVKAFVEEILEEFRRRREERRGFENQWRLNQNFVMGNQYCDISISRGEVVDLPSVFDAETMSVYNQIEPIVEVRLSKLARVQPGLTVRPATSDNSDIVAAITSTRILQAFYEAQEMKSKGLELNTWAENCGGVLMKTVWDTQAGAVLGYRADTKGKTRPVYEGDLLTSAVPYYEFFPKSSYVTDLEQQDSVIHAKAYSVDEIKRIWGVELEGKQLNVFSMESTDLLPGGIGYNHSSMHVKENTIEKAELVLEYYEKPNTDFPNGRHAIVVGDYLVYLGELEYQCGKYYRRSYPFVHQRCLFRPGVFWGSSVVERCIPIQRDYNAIQNRINEATARISIGNLVAERGAITDDEILQNGIAPGQVLEYEPGHNPPDWMKPQEIPQSMLTRIEKLEQQFTVISGVSELSKTSNTPPAVSSGTALEVLKEQDDTRLTLTAENIRNAYAEWGKRCLRMAKQFVSGPRISRVVGEDFGDVFTLTWNGNMITSDDVVVSTVNEMLNTPAQRKQTAMQAFTAGLFNDPDTGTLTREGRATLMKILDLGNYEAANDIDDRQNVQARRENMFALRGTAPHTNIVDNHPLHIAEHTKFVLSAEFRALREADPRMAQTFLDHLQEHKDTATEQAMALQGQGAPAMASAGQTLPTAMEAQAQQNGALGANQ